MTNSTLEIAKSSDQEAWDPAALDERREHAREHLARLAEKREYWVEQNRYYYKLLGRLLQFLEAICRPRPNNSNGIIVIGNNCSQNFGGVIAIASNGTLPGNSISQLPCVRKSALLSATEDPS